MHIRLIACVLGCVASHVLVFSVFHTRRLQSVRGLFLGMPLDVVLCELCHRFHDLSHRCAVRRFDASPWIHHHDSSVVLPVPVHELPAFDVICPHCNARSCRDEHMNCCGSGRVMLPIGDVVPAELQDVILSSHVRSNIRR